MAWMTLSLGLMVVATALVTGLAALALMVRLAPARRVTWTPFDQIGSPTAFLFLDDELVDATDEGRRLLAAGPEQMADWQRLQAVLTPRFPDISAALSELGRVQRLEVLSGDGVSRLRAEWRDGLARIEIDAEAAAEGPGAGHDSLSLTALHDELSDLRATIDAAPMLVWKTDAGGAVRWANSAYIERALARDPESDTLSWPLPTLFPDPPWPDPGGDDAAAPLRLTLEEPDGTSVHYEAWSMRHGASRLAFAIEASRLVKAEDSLREFLQTLTKTFAHLPIGLAVFDRSRRLVMFNPALTDLSGLQPLFLSRQPRLVDFLDQLREARRMPEPKDYREWRRRISELEEAAAHGTHIETWPLPDGQTFRVTGRPHPDGAIAFLFEDITSEVALTRRFRSELELGQAVVDSLAEAIAVFSPSGALVLSNAAYDALWGCEDSATLRPSSYETCAAEWQALCQPAPVWPDMAAVVRAAGADRQGWSGELRLKDGRALSARVAPIAGNATLVGFIPQAAGEAPLAPVDAAPGAETTPGASADLPEASANAPAPDRHVGTAGGPPDAGVDTGAGTGTGGEVAATAVSPARREARRG